MPAVFSSTTHALRNEPYYFITQLGMGIAIVIMLFWSFWFFYGSIYHYVSSQFVQITLEPQPVWRIPDGQYRVKSFHRYQITAYFSRKDARRIQPHQMAALYLEGSSTIPSRPFKLEVNRVNIKTGAVHLTLEQPQKTNHDSIFLLDESSRIEIAVLRQSPAAFLFHTVTPK